MKPSNTVWYKLHRLVVFGYGPVRFEMTVNNGSCRDCWNVILVTFLCCLFERYVSVISNGGKFRWREVPMAGSSENFREAEFCLRGHCCILTAFVRSMVISGIALVMRE